MSRLRLREVKAQQLHVKDFDAVVPKRSVPALCGDLGEQGLCSIGFGRDKGSERTSADRGAKLRREDVAQARFRTRLVENRLKEAFGLGYAPQDGARCRHGSLLKRQEFAQWGLVNKQPAVELGHAFVRQLHAKARRGDYLHRPAERRDNGLLPIANGEKT